MKVDTKLRWGAAGCSLAELTESGSRAQSEGYDGMWSAESAHDPFLPLIAAAQETSTLQLGTAITVAFARNPMSLAYTAYDMQQLTRGRFMLGLGSQVRPHIERRFGMPWSRPAARMREFIQALRQIWTTWSTGERLNFQGEFYSHTLMTPFFSPPRSEWGHPPIYLAAVGEMMTETAGAVCDGLLPHPFTTPEYLRDSTIPALRRGLAQAGRPVDACALSLSGLVACGRTEAELAAAVQGVRRQIAFYGSTPAYHPVLALHGWSELGEQLNRLSRTTSEQRWQQMADLVDDEVLHTFAIVAPPEELGPAIQSRYGDLVDRFSFYAPYDHEETLWQPSIEYLAAVGGSTSEKGPLHDN